MAFAARATKRDETMEAERLTCSRARLDLLPHWRLMVDTLAAKVNRFTPPDAPDKQLTKGCSFGCGACHGASVARHSGRAVRARV